MNTATQEIAAHAARLVVEEGLEYGPAKRRAARQLGLPYLYLGYWIEGSRKMNYKTRFHPQERLTGNGWERVKRQK